MPIPTPRKDEEQDEFVSRCMSSDVMKEEYDEQEQRLAVCHSQWRRSQKDARDAASGYCPADLSKVTPEGVFEGYAALFNQPDAYGDVILPGAFVAAIEELGPGGVKMLYQHDADRPIGVWDRVEEDAQGLRVRGRLVLETEDGRECRALMEAGAIDGLSVGWIGEEAQDNEHGGKTYSRVGLFEVSVVTFPAGAGAALDGLRHYGSNRDLPRAIRELLPGEAQTAWRRAWNSYVRDHPATTPGRAAAAAWREVKKAWRSPEKEAGMWVARVARDAAPIEVHDRAQVKSIRRTADGYLAAIARVARAGVQAYRGAELGRPDLEEVRVYRPPGEVFSKDALRSFAHRPVTVGHPPEMVSADNWRSHAVGHTGDEVARDGEFVRVPLVLMDADAIRAVESGQRELSMGYTMILRWEGGETEHGEAYDAVQTGIRGNHLAVVAAARGGRELRIGDEGDREGDRQMTTKTLTLDGLDVEVTDAAAKIIQKHVAQLEARVKKLQEDLEEEEKKGKTKDEALAAREAVVQTKDAELEALKKKLADETSPAAIDAAVKVRAEVVEKARSLVGDKLQADGKSVEEVRRQVVLARVGDRAKEWTDDMVRASFDSIDAGTLTADAGRQFARALGSAGAGGSEGDKAYDEMKKNVSDAWRKPPGAAAA